MLKLIKKDTLTNSVLTFIKQLTKTILLQAKNYFYCLKQEITEFQTPSITNIAVDLIFYKNYIKKSLLKQSYIFSKKIVMQIYFNKINA